TAGVGRPTLAPEPFSKLHQRSVYQSMRTTTGLVFRELARRLSDLPAETRALAQRVFGFEQVLLSRFRRILNPDMTGFRIRVHGNYHLGELLHVGTEFQVIDFEGDADRPLSERRIKRSPLVDVASLVRSFQYVALGPLYG